ncbi:unnamed protein product [Haemonchus placei]|uniref:Rab-GAP TBC domain-containing protein n=1 Tax=Haemonchus placei TaxID=6290 RepID=A0A158QMQ5_HAEPC|nr:unnamed protein product [Haemonchus placei]
MRKDYAKFWADYFPIVIRRRKRWEKADPRRNPSTQICPLNRSQFQIWLRNCAPRGAPRVVNVPESVVEAIRLDLPRTFPNNQYLRSERVRNALGRVLYSLAQHVPSVGYCQGLNFVAGLILLVLKDESKASDLLVQIVRQRQDYYNESMSGLQRDTKVLQWILSKECPEVVRTLKALDVGLDLIIGKWFLCWFAEVLPLEVG